MRLGEQRRKDMQNKILEDLYNNINTDLKQQRVDIAKRNREIQLAPLMIHIDNLPELFKTKDTHYILQIRYKKIKDTDDEYLLHEKWKYSVDDPIINPVDPEYYYNNPPQKLVKELLPDAAKLCEDILVYQKEYKDMKTYLHTALKECNSTNQLKKVFPESLHKYIPVDTPKAKSTRTVLSTIAVPDHLSIRQTTNLLESN